MECQARQALRQGLGRNGAVRDLPGKVPPCEITEKACEITEKRAIPALFWLAVLASLAGGGKPSSSEDRRRSETRGLRGAFPDIVHAAHRETASCRRERAERIHDVHGQEYGNHSGNPLVFSLVSRTAGGWSSKGVCPLFPFKGVCPLFHLSFEGVCPLFQKKVQTSVSRLATRLMIFAGFPTAMQ